ncbi:Nitrite transporter NirC [Corynebacterium provencense]|uniref:Nitrite transporter NirC n=2 Tax=Corynebacteriaceae TaxID=1653 RepID=A0A2Z3YTR8_9CORY|nr:Nitrite transporter NirC [Corynebacterium provencense]
MRVRSLGVNHDVSTGTAQTEKPSSPDGAMNTAADAAIRKKSGLFADDPLRYGVRAVLAGAYLTLGTAFAVVAGDAVNDVAPGLGPVVFGMCFFIGLAMILQVGAELATGTMMFMVFGAVRGHLSWGRAVSIIMWTVVLNLVGAVLVAVILGQSGKMGGLGADHLLATLSDGKLHKGPWGVLSEGILANCLVNVAILGGLTMKDYAGKFLFIQFVIGAFVVLGLEHVIANFSLFTLSLFCLGDGFASGADVLPSLTWSNVLDNWGMALLGNFIGGGLIIGGLYSWLNHGSSQGARLYRD